MCDSSLRTTAAAAAAAGRRAEDEGSGTYTDKLGIWGAAALSADTRLASRNEDEHCDGKGSIQSSPPKNNANPLPPKNKNISPQSKHFYFSIFLILVLLASFNKVIVSSSEHQLYKIRVIQILINRHIFFLEQLLNPSENLLVLFSMRSIAVVFVSANPFLHCKNKQKKK